MKAISRTTGVIASQRVGMREYGSTKVQKAITMENLSPRIVRLQYAVRGPLFLRLVEIERELNKGVPKPFNKVIKANIGDCHDMGQKPITFIRQVLACVSYPKLIKSHHFPQDVRDKAASILDECLGNSIGSYSSDIGFDKIRRSVADYITARDGYEANMESVCLTPGASIGIKNFLQLFTNTVNGKPSGVMVPIPQYPLYSATLAEYGLDQVDYYLDEKKSWALTPVELERALQAGTRHCNVKAIVVINPGNPTGQVLTRENIESIIKFAHKHSILILADEVYQHNIYEGEFHSFKKILTELGAPYNRVELVSFMSASKGFMGECGIRGGWMEMVNIDPHVQANLYKCITARLCPTTLGQTVVECVTRPPKEGDESYELFLKQKTDVLGSLKVRAAMVEEMFNKMDGFSCNTVQGAMYAFPQIRLPQKAIESAKKAGQEPDVFYAFQLLEETGICVVPGSGFGQEPGTYHFRTTILPQTELLREMLEVFQKFHERFTRKYL